MPVPLDVPTFHQFAAGSGEYAIAQARLIRSTAAVIWCFFVGHHSELAACNILESGKLQETVYRSAIARNA